MKILANMILLLAVFLNSGCSDTNPTPQIDDNPSPTLKYLALGDSYTIGESVCATCRFPEQLKDSIQNNLNSSVDLRIIAQTGWTTTNLKNAINTGNLASDYDLVTLLIGVNNQYQDKPFSLYEHEFAELIAMAIAAANGDKYNIVVISISDYGFTPFGQSNQAAISAEIDQYNAFAESYCEQNAIEFINITDITRQGLSNPNLVAPDGLHPSKDAYTEFVERILPSALLTLEN